jgi:hypothetical protein
MKVPNKKDGFLYCVRCIANGKLLPSKWNTRINLPEKARQFALADRERIVTGYFESKNTGLPNNQKKLYF